MGVKVGVCGGWCCRLSEDPLRAKCQVTLISPRFGLGLRICCRHRRRLILDIRLGPRAGLLALQSLHKVAPADHGLAGVEPDTRGNAHQHGAQIFNHIYLKDGTCLGCARRSCGRAGYGEGFADVAMPLDHPLVEIIILIEQAAEQTQSGQYEEAREESDAQHEPLQLVRPFPIGLHHGANAKERDETRQQEECSDREVYAEWQYQKRAQRVGIQLTHKAHAGEYVAWKREEESESNVIEVAERQREGSLKREYDIT